MSAQASHNEALPSISHAEWEVMKVIWDRGPMAARDVCAALAGSTGWAPKTVKSLLSRLVAKGALEYDQVGNSYLYRAACDRDHVTREEVKGFVERVLDGSVMPVVAHFIEENHLSEDEIAQLQRLLEEKEQGLKKDTKGR